MDAEIYISSDMESDSDIEIIDLIHPQVQDINPVNPSNITRSNPQGSPDHEETEETEENRNEENVEEANVELGEREVDNEEEEEELEDEEETEDDGENIGLDETEGEDPEWKSVGSIKELVSKYGSLASMEPELIKHIKVVRSWLADYYLTNNQVIKFEWNTWLNRYRLERLVQKMNKKERRARRRT